MGRETPILGSSVLVPEAIDFSAVHREVIRVGMFALSLALNGWWTRFEKQVRLLRNGA
jgi:hypothetical protein